MSALHLSEKPAPRAIKAWSDAIHPASSRWSAIAAAFAHTGGWVSGNELADLIRRQGQDDDRFHVAQPVSLVARWIVSGQVISVDTPWGDMLPLFQFDLHRAELRPGVAMVRAELQGALDGIELALWFVTPHEGLQGDCPAIALQTRLPEVRRAARQLATGD